jgi:hypothetical protein
MDALELDYRTVLLASHEPPCISIYQPTHRSHPDRQQDPIRFRNLVRGVERSLERLGSEHGGSVDKAGLEPFHRLAADVAFWNDPRDGLAVFGAPGTFRVYKLQRPVRELAVASDSFHTKPLARLLQSADSYLLVGLDRQRARLYQGNRYGLDEIEAPAGFPTSMAQALGAQEGEPERSYRVYGPPAGVTAHGTDVRKEELDRERERYFRAVDEAVLDYQRGQTPMSLVLAALPEHQHAFRRLSRNPALLDRGIDVDPGAFSAKELRERAWELILPRYLDRLAGLIDSFEAARANGSGADGLNQVAKAAAEARIATLLVEADREIPGRFDPATGIVRQARSAEPLLDDLLDDVAERTIRTGGEVVVVPKERMPTDTGLAATFRF